MSSAKNVAAVVTWASTTLCDNAADLDLLAGLPELPADAVFESSHLVQHALLGGVLLGGGCAAAGAWWDSLHGETPRPVDDAVRVEG